MIRAIEYSIIVLVLSETGCVAGVSGEEADLMPDAIEPLFALEGSGEAKADGTLGIERYEFLRVGTDRYELVGPDQAGWEFASSSDEFLRVVGYTGDREVIAMDLLIYDQNQDGLPQPGDQFAIQVHGAESGYIVANHTGGITEHVPLGATTAELLSQLTQDFAREADRIAQEAERMMSTVKHSAATAATECRKPALTGAAIVSGFSVFPLVLAPLVGAPLVVPLAGVAIGAAVFGFLYALSGPSIEECEQSHQDWHEEAGDYRAYPR